MIRAMSETFEIRVHHIPLFHRATVLGEIATALHITRLYLADIVTLNLKWRTRGNDPSSTHAVIAYEDVIGQSRDRIGNIKSDLTETEQAYAIGLSNIFLTFTHLPPTTSVRLITTNKDHLCQLAATGAHCTAPTTVEYCSPDEENALLRKLKSQVPEISINEYPESSLTHGMVLQAHLMRFFSNTSISQLSELFYPSNPSSPLA